MPPTPEEAHAAQDAAVTAVEHLMTVLYSHLPPEVRARRVPWLMAIRDRLIELDPDEEMADPK